ncbi:MAG: YbaN family protein [Marvinbryantia sp.]|jgi:uncharacterized membrane protein YbaN (DUF454 family)
MKKILYIILGYVSVGIGAIGAVLPVLPVFPFLMLAAFCFARSSKKLDSWFKSTKLYKNNFADFVESKGMTRKTKCRIMSIITLLMSIGFFMMGIKSIITGCIVLGCVWIFHLAYFIFGIKTIPVMEENDK